MYYSLGKAHPTKVWPGKWRFYIQYTINYGTKISEKEH